MPCGQTGRAGTMTDAGARCHGLEGEAVSADSCPTGCDLSGQADAPPSSYASDTDVSVPVVTRLAERKVRDELFADTAYGSCFEASRRGTRTKERVTECRSPPRTFRSTSQGSRPRCSLPATRPGVRAVRRVAGNPCWQSLPMPTATCAGAYVQSGNLVKVNIERRRRAEAHRGVKRYDDKPGIEGTNW